MVNFKANHPQEVRHEMRGGKGDVTITKVVSEGLCPNARMFATITLPVGASIGYHVHENETELFCFVSGEGKVNDDGREVAKNTALLMGYAVLFLCIAYHLTKKKVEG